MGEIADDHWEALAFADPFDIDDWYGDNPYRSRARPARVRCNRCGAPATWQHTGERWRLVDDDGNPHSCTKPASADEFEDVS